PPSATRPLLREGRRIADRTVPNFPLRGEESAAGRCNYAPAGFPPHTSPGTLRRRPPPPGVFALSGTLSGIARPAGAPARRRRLGVEACHQVFAPAPPAPRPRDPN